MQSLLASRETKWVAADLRDSDGGEGARNRMLQRSLSRADLVGNGLEGTKALIHAIDGQWITGREYGNEESLVIEVRSKCVASIFIACAIELNAGGAKFSRMYSVRLLDGNLVDKISLENYARTIN